MAEGKIQLSLTESFVKHKRNLLLVSSIVIVLAAALPESVKLPGLGTEESVPASVAYFLLLAVLSYFGSSYWVELLAVRAQNVGGGGDDTPTQLSSKLSKSIEPLEVFINGIVSKHRNSKEILLALEQSIKKCNIDKLSENVSTGVSGMFRARLMTVTRDDGTIVTNEEGLDSFIKQIPMHIGDGFKNIEKDLSSVSDKLDRVIEFSDKLELKMSDMVHEASKLTKELRLISNRISRSQRIGFGALEQFVPIALGTFALILCLDGAFNHSDINRWARSYVPALKAVDHQSADSDVMPKVGTQSAVTRQNP